MGTVFTIDVRDRGDWAEAIGTVVALLHRIDAVFSTYRPDSEICRIRSGALRVADASPAVRTVLDRCADASLATHGAFSAMHGGRIDPTGLVKGWAIDEAGAALRDVGCRNFAINGGGDVLVRGEAAPGRPWGVGIVDPHNRTRMLETVTGHGLAIATSGTAERGLHIADPFTGRPADGLASATVIGPSMTEADAYATAAFVLGRHALTWIAGVAGYEALLITHEGSLLASAGWAAAAGRTGRVENSPHLLEEMLPPSG
jgi:thiamine biosynthesis lipoprotein